FASLLPAGAYEYSYLARATTPGTIVVPPPRAEMMYQPETFGRGRGAVVINEETKTGSGVGRGSGIRARAGAGGRRLARHPSNNGISPRGMPEGCEIREPPGQPPKARCPQRAPREIPSYSCNPLPSPPAIPLPLPDSFPILSRRNSSHD